MAGLTGSQPTNLRSPVPSEGTERDIFAEIESQMQNLKAAPTPSAAPQEEQAAMSSMDAGLPPAAPTPDPMLAQAAPAPQGDIFDEIQGQIQVASAAPPAAPLSKTETVTFMDRAKASFLSTPKEQREFLDERYGKDNVRFRRGGFEVRNSAEDDFEQFDEEGFSITRDIFADGARLFTETALDAASMFAGAAVAAKAAGTGAIAGAPLGPVGAIAGGIAGGVGAFYAAEAVREYFLDVEKDPGRSLLAEGAVSGGLGALGGMVGAVGRGLRKGNTIAKALPKKQGVEGLADTIAKDVDELEQTQNALKSMKIIPEDVDFNKPQFIQGADQTPFMKQDIELMRSLPQYNSMVLEYGNVTKKAVEGFVQDFQSRVGEFKSLDTLEILKAAGKQEGEMIGRFRDAATKFYGKEPVAVQKTGEFTSSLVKKLKRAGAPDSRNLNPQQFEFLYGMSPEKSKLAFNLFNNVNDRVVNESGLLKVAELDNIYDRMQMVTNGAYGGADRGYFRFLDDMRSAVRDDYTSAIEKAVDPLDGSYKAELKKFNALMNSKKKLRTLLSKDEVTEDALISTLLNKSAGNLDTIKAFKTIMLETDPAAWDKLSASWLSKKIDAATDINSGAVNFNKLSEDLLKRDATLTKLVMSGAGEEGGEEALKQMLLLGRRAQNALKNGTAKPAENVKTGVLRSMAILLSNTFVSSKIGAVTTLSKMFGGSRNVKSFLEGGGEEYLLKQIKDPVKRSKVQEQLAELFTVEQREQAAKLYRRANKGLAVATEATGSKAMTENVRGAVSER